MNILSDYLFRFLFPEKETYVKKLEFKQKEIIKVVNDLKSENEEYKRLVKTINRISRNYLIVDIIKPKDKNDFHKIIYKTFDEGVFVLTSAYQDLLDPLCRVFVTDNGDSLYIEDIQNSNYVNKGYGSILMDYLINTAKQNNMKKITGVLSIVDRDHRDRSERFYRKHGFTIKGDHLVLILG